MQTAARGSYAPRAGPTIKLVRTPGLEPGRDYSQGILSP